jgi:hypothetical protein
MKSIATNKVLRIALFAVIGIALVALMARYLPPGVDWDQTYRPAARALLTGKNPYSVLEFANPVWCLLPLLPLAILPSEIGRAAYLLMSLLGFGYAAHRFKASPVALVAFLVSPPVLHCLLNSNIDWMTLVGFALPPQIGLFMVVIKPQIGYAVALFWLVEAWRNGKWREVVRVFWPLTAAMALSIAIFGTWPLKSFVKLDYWWNASLWPLSIPVGLGLMAAALRTHRVEYAMGASPCLSPYLLFHSWSGALLAIVSLPVETVAVVIGLWIMVVLRTVG